MAMHQHSNLQMAIHPGQVVNDLYPLPDNHDLQKQKRKNIFTTRFIQQLPSLAFGSQGLLLTINNVGMLADSILALTFKPGTLRQLPAVTAVKRMDVIIAGSQQYTVNFDDNYLFSLAQTENYSKIQEIVALAGGNGGAIASNTTYYVPLSLPFSMIRNAHRKFPFDASLLNSPVKIFLYLNDASNIYSSVTPPAELAGGELIMRQGLLSDSSERLALGDKTINYPFPFLQSFTSTSFTPVNTTTPVDIYLSGFRSGDLSSIYFRCLDVANIDKQNFTLNTMSNIIVRINGNILYQYDFDSNKLFTLFESNVPPKVNLGGVDYYYVPIHFSHRAIKNAMGNEVQSGLNAQSQLIQVTFTSSSTNAQVLKCLYVYQSGVLVAGGNAEIVV